MHLGKPRQGHRVLRQSRRGALGISAGDKGPWPGAAQCRAPGAPAGLTAQPAHGCHAGRNPQSGTMGHGTHDPPRSGPGGRTVSALDREARAGPTHLGPEHLVWQSRLGGASRISQRQCLCRRSDGKISYFS